MHGATQASIKLTALLVMERALCTMEPHVVSPRRGECVLLCTFDRQEDKISENKSNLPKIVNKTVGHCSIFEKVKRVIRVVKSKLYSDGLHFDCQLCVLGS